MAPALRDGPILGMVIDTRFRSREGDEGRDPSDWMDPKQLLRGLCVGPGGQSRGDGVQGRKRQEAALL